MGQTSGPGPVQAVTHIGVRKSNLRATGRVKHHCAIVPQVFQGEQPGGPAPPAAPPTAGAGGSASPLQQPQQAARGAGGDGGCNGEGNAAGSGVGGSREAEEVLTLTLEQLDVLLRQQTAFAALERDTTHLHGLLQVFPAAPSPPFSTHHMLIDSLVRAQRTPTPVLMLPEPAEQKSS